jgi:hypothetical protein
MNSRNWEIQPGMFFDTPSENGCEVLSSPDRFGNFEAIDSYGDKCKFNVSMVKKVRR